MINIFISEDLSVKSYFIKQKTFGSSLYQKFLLPLLIIDVKRQTKRKYTMNKSNFIFALMLPLVFMASSCCDGDADTAPPQEALSERLPTTDIMSTTIEAAYAEYGPSINDNFAQAVMNRHTFGKASANQDIVKSVFVGGDNLSTLSTQDYKDIVSCILEGKALLIVNPTMSEWNKFATSIAEAYVLMIEDAMLPENSTEEGMNFFNRLVHDVREHQDGDIYGLPISKSETLGVNDVFSSILYIKAGDVRSYDNDILQEPDSVKSVEYKYDKDGTLVSSKEDSDWNTVMPNCEANAYAVGLMADDVVEHISETPSEYAVVKAFSSRNAESDLKQLMSAQQFTKVFRVDNYAADVRFYYDKRSCIVETNYYIWSVYDFDNDKDYYIVHQTITSHNGDLHCTSGNKDWDNIIGDDYVFLGSWAGDVATQIDLIDVNGQPVKNVQVIDPQPKTYQGSVSHTTGMMLTLGGNLGFNMSGPTGGINGAVSFTESYTTSTPDYATELNTSGSKIQWNFNATNSHIKGHYSFFAKNATHDVIPSCYRNDCTFNQSFIYAIQNPTSSRYSLDVYTKQDFVTYEGLNTFFYMTDSYKSYRSDERYKLELNPPTRYKADWYMSVDVPQGISQESVRRFLQVHYGKYWKETFTCYTFTENDTLPVSGMMYALEKDIKNDLASWKSAGFVGKFCIYVHPSTSPTVLKKIEFTVE